jgi:hypothetical protein
MRNLNGWMTGRMTGRMDEKEKDDHHHPTDKHLKYYITRLAK